MTWTSWGAVVVVLVLLVATCAPASASVRVPGTLSSGSASSASTAPSVGPERSTDTGTSRDPGASNGTSSEINASGYDVVVHTSPAATGDLEPLGAARGVDAASTGDADVTFDEFSLWGRDVGVTIDPIGDVIDQIPWFVDVPNLVVTGNSTTVDRSNGTARLYGYAELNSWDVPDILETLGILSDVGGGGAGAGGFVRFEPVDGETFRPSADGEATLRVHQTVEGSALLQRGGTAVTAISIVRATVSSNVSVYDETADRFVPVEYVDEGARTAYNRVRPGPEEFLGEAAFDVVAAIVDAYSRIGIGGGVLLEWVGLEKPELDGTERFDTSEPVVVRFPVTEGHSYTVAHDVTVASIVGGINTDGRAETNAAVTVDQITVDLPEEANEPPTAGFEISPASPTAGTTVTFDARDSSDVDGSITSYAWDFDGDGAVDATTTGPDTTHVYESPGDYRVTLTVTDDDGTTASETVTIVVDPDRVETVVELVPGATTVAVGDSTTFDVVARTVPAGVGSYEFEFASSDAGVATVTDVRPNGNPSPATRTIDFAPDGASVSVRAALLGDTDVTTLATVTVGANAEGTSTVRLSDVTVGSASGAASYDVVTTGTADLTVERPEPTADAGPNRTVRAGTTVELDAMRSSAPDGGSLTYEWTQTGGPSVALSAADTATPTFTAPSASGGTTLTFEVTVRDGNGGSDAAAVSITVIDDDVRRETAVLGADGGTIRAAPDSTVEVPVVVRGVPSDAPLIAVRDVRVSVSNASVAKVAYVPGPALSGNPDRPGTVRAGDFSGTDRMEVTEETPTSVTFTAAPITSSASGDVVVGHVRLNTTETPGTTALDLSIRDGRTANRTTVEFDTRGATLDTTTVEQPFPDGVPGVPGSQPPTDPIPDEPGFEDVDGDGEGTFGDVVALLFALESLDALSTSQTTALDFDDSGAVGFGDVVALLFRL